MRYICFLFCFLFCPFISVAQEEQEEGVTSPQEDNVSLFSQENDDDENASTVTAPTKPENASSRVLRGRVLSASTLMPLSGVLVKSGNNSVLTDDDGSYTFTVPKYISSIFISTPDYNSVSIGLTSETDQKDVYLYPSEFTSDLCASISENNPKLVLNDSYTTSINVKEDLQSHLASSAYTQIRGGTPGIGGVMFIQGLNSLNVNAEPLVVIDGVIVDQQYGRDMLHSGLYNDILSSINISDIERVTVMRNGCALYGSKGANGVILIETRRCKSMATRITASVSAGVTFVPKFISVMDASGYKGYASELLKTTGTKLQSFKFLTEDATRSYYYDLYHNDTNWRDHVYRTAITQNYGINVEGGDEVATYNLSVGYVNAQSNLCQNDFDRLNIRFNTDIELSSRFGVRFDISFSNITRDVRDDGAPVSYDEGTVTSPGFLSLVKSPFLNPYSYGAGSYSDSQLDISDENYLDEALANLSNYNYKLANPLAILEYGEGEIKNRFENSLFNVSVTPKFKFTPHFYLSEHFSYNLVNTNEKYYVPVNGVPSYYVTSVANVVENEVRSLFSKQNSLFSDTRLDWSNVYGAHDVHLFGGCRIVSESYTYNTQLGYNTGSDKTPFMSSGLNYSSTSGTQENWRSLAYYLQGEYNYRSRYFLRGNLTLESSSLFGSEASGLSMFGVVWGLFPSIQASWVLTNESWLADVKALDYLRLSVGYDVSGNDNIDINAARSYFKAVTYFNSVSGLKLGGIGNTEIKWETTRRLNAGIDFGIINNRVNLSFNYFKSWTSDLLTFKSLSFLTGLEGNWSNGGKLENSGFDVSLSVKAIVKKDWRWEVGCSMGHYKNKITELPDGNSFIDTEYYGATIRSEVGSVANLFYGYRTEGVFSSTADAESSGLYILGSNGIDRNYFSAGDVHFVDKDGNGCIDESDRVVIGDPNPDIYGNIFTSLIWKRLRLDVCFNYSLGNDAYNYLRSQLEGGSRFMNQSTSLLNRWQVEGQVTDVPKVTFQDPMGNSRFSDRWIEDASYLRLKSITLSYDLPINSTFLQGLEFWLQCNNLFTLTRYLGSDPEFVSTSSVIGQGVDTGILPQSRSIVAGIKINL